MHTGHWLFAAFRTELAAPQAPASSGSPPVSATPEPLSPEPPLLLPPVPPPVAFGAQAASPTAMQSDSTAGAPLLLLQDQPDTATHSSKNHRTEPILFTLQVWLAAAVWSGFLTCHLG